MNYARQARSPCFCIFNRLKILELLQLVEVYGHDVHVFLFRSLISHLDLKNTKASQDQIRLQLLGQELAVVVNKSNFVSIICQAFEGAQLTDEFCSNLSKLLKLNFSQHFTFGLALAQSIDPGVQQQGSFACLVDCIEVFCSRL